MSVLLCKCGCGTEIKPMDNRGRPRRFLNGHQNIKHRHKKIPLVPCACNCGEMIPSMDHKFRPVLYKTGHTRKNTLSFLDSEKKVLERESLARARKLMDLLDIEKTCMVGDLNCINPDRVEVHHLDHDHFNNNIDNLIFLCVSHHRLMHTRKVETLNELKNLVLDYYVDGSGRRRWLSK